MGDNAILPRLVRHAVNNKEHCSRDLKNVTVADINLVYMVEYTVKNFVKKDVISSIPVQSTQEYEINISWNSDKPVTLLCLENIIKIAPSKIKNIILKAENIATKPNAFNSLLAQTKPIIEDNNFQSIVLSPEINSFTITVIVKLDNEDEKITLKRKRLSTENQFIQFEIINIDEFVFEKCNREEVAYFAQLVVSLVGDYIKISTEKQTEINMSIYEDDNVTGFWIVVLDLQEISYSVVEKIILHTCPRLVDIVFFSNSKNLSMHIGILNLTTPSKIFYVPRNAKVHVL